MFAKRCPTGASSAGLEVEVVTTAVRRARAVLCCAAALVLIGAWATGVAGAAITSINSFDLSPTSGPPGTVVSFAGTACTPGFSAASDYVEIRAPAFQVVVRAPVAANGSWHGSFTVPASAPATGLASLVLATCYSDGFVSITTIYSAQTFTVTAPPATTTTNTTPTTPTTKPGGSGGTTPPTHGDPGPDGGNEPGSTVPVFGGVPPDSSGGNTGGGAHNGGSATKPPGAKKADVSRATHRAARAADLSVPALPAARVAGTGGLGWLAWLLVSVLLVSAVGAPLWLRRSRRSQADLIGDGA